MRIVKKKWFISLVGVLVVVVFLVTYWLVETSVKPQGLSRKTWVSIPAGTSTSEIASILEKHHVITNGFFFRLYLYVTGNASNLQAGDYRFTHALTLPQVVNELRVGAVMYNTISVTIPEGYTVRQIADVLAKNGIVSKTAFMAEVHKGQFSFDFLPKLGSQNKLVRDRLEGYLFPDTYDFLRHEPAYDVITTMLQETNKVFSPRLMTRIKQMHTSVTRILTIASMIEREAELNKERPIIASVIYNRLKINMKLQIDATVEYALGGVLNLTDADLTVNNPYNTYLHYGLPPGPIANPGLLSIEAALHPAKTNYYFYVAKFNGSGGHYFSTTFAQQLANEVKSQQNYTRYERGLSSPPHSVHKP